MSIGGAMTGRSGHLAFRDIPGWDNHSHAGFADDGVATSSRPLRGFFTQRPWAYIEACIPQTEFCSYRVAFPLSGDKTTARAIHENYPVGKWIGESAEMLQFATIKLPSEENRNYVHELPE